MFENVVKNYKNFVIKSEEGIEKGLFFRSPIQKVDFGTWDEDKFNAYTYLSKIKNPLFKFMEILKGNRNIVDNIEGWAEEDNGDWAGFKANVLCLPIYFSRVFRRLEAISQTLDTNIQIIKSYGYESQFNKCGGSCVIEKTVFKLKNGKKIKVSKPGNFKYTYEFKIEEVIDSGSDSVA